jgi:enoyl-CoA hydratase/carnithine racemase
MAERVSVRTEAPGVAVVTMHSPPANFISIDLLLELVEAVEAAGDHRVAVLAGEGKHFCAGAKLTPGGGMRSTRSDDGAHFYDHAIRLFTQPMPLVAAVHGAAVGAGLGLALACDFRVACSSARFVANFSQLGFHPGFGISETLPRVVGSQLTLDMLYTGRRVTGEEAFSAGLCDRFVDTASAEDNGAAAVLARAVELASQVASSAPLAVRSIRQTQRAALAERVRAIMDHEKAEQDRLSRTADFKEGVAATAERRPPNFVGA